MMRAMRIFSLFLAAAPIVALAGGAAPERKYPEFEFKDAHPVLIVASLAPGGGLGEFEECKRPHVICLHSPEWFRAKTLMTVYGEQMPARLEVYSASHYGQERYEDTGPVLVNLFVKDGVALMPINQYLGLHETRNGELFLPIEYPYWPGFLPCEVRQLWEEIGTEKFKEPLRQYDRKEYDWQDVERNPELFVVSHDHAVPRYGIRMTRLQDFLRGTELARTNQRCESPEDKAEREAEEAEE